MSRCALLCLLFACFAPAQGQDPFGDDPFGTTTGQGSQDPFGSGAMDPFGGSTNAGGVDGFNAAGASSTQQPAGDGGADAVAADSLQTAEPDDDPIVRLLRQRTLETPQDFADGLTWVVRLQRWDEVRRLLDQIAARNWSLEQLAELSRLAGSALWIRLRNDEAELNEQQQQLVGEILRAPAKLARQPSWIDAWINRLSSDNSPGERRLAQLKLQDAGPKAIEMLVGRLLDGDTEVAPVMLAGTATLFGDSGVAALRTACTVDDEQRAARVFLALAKLSSKQFTAELAAGLQSRHLSNEHRSLLSDLLKNKYGRLPERDAIESYLRKEFDRRQAVYSEARTAANPTLDLVWQVSADGKKVQAVDGSLELQSLGSWAQLAILKSRTAGQDPLERVQDAVAILQREYQFQPQELDPRWRERLDADGTSTIAFWQQVFEQASDWQMHGAAVNALRCLQSSTSAASAPLDFVSQLLRDPRPIVRFTALELIHEWDPTAPYAGSEKALQTAFEMSKLGGGPQALIVGLQADVRQAAKQQIQALTGADANVANSARAALQILNGSDPIEVVLIVDRVADQSLFEFFQRIRKSSKGQAIPIAVLTDELYPHERRWIAGAGGVVQSVLSRNLEQMQRVYDRLMDELDTEPLSRAERARFAQLGRQFLARISSDRSRYSFYPIHDYQLQLVSTAVESTTQQRIEILSGLGSRQSQLELVQLAANLDLPSEQRIAAANAFRSSVKQFGNQLDREGVVQSYEWYNKHGPDDSVSVRSLGHVLDVIEAFAGKREWPAPL